MKYSVCLVFLIVASISCRDNRQSRLEKELHEAHTQISELKTRISECDDKLKKLLDSDKTMSLMETEQTKLKERLASIEEIRGDNEADLNRLAVGQKALHGSFDIVSAAQRKTDERVAILDGRTLKILEFLENKTRASSRQDSEYAAEKASQIAAIKARIAKLSARENELAQFTSQRPQIQGHSLDQRRAWERKDREAMEPYVKELQSIRELLLDENARLNELLNGSR